MRRRTYRFGPALLASRNELTSTVTAAVFSLPAVCNAGRRPRDRFPGRRASMLVVTQKEDAWIAIEPIDGLDLSMTLREAFAHGPILIKLMHVGRRRVRLGIEAPGLFRVLRGITPSYHVEVGAPGTAIVTPLWIGKGA